MMVQEQYWRELFQLKTNICFIENQLEVAEKRERQLKMVLAIASSSSIGAWAIWKDLSYIWTGIIALSQVISAINPFLPYKNRIKEYSSLVRELEEIMIKSEFRWHAIAEGELTSKEINNARFEIQAAKQRALNKHITTTIPANEKLQNKAEETATAYLKTFYLVEV